MKTCAGCGLPVTEPEISRAGYFRCWHWPCRGQAFCRAPWGGKPTLCHKRFITRKVRELRRRKRVKPSETSGRTGGPRR